MWVFKVLIVIQYFVNHSYSSFRIVGGKEAKIDDFPYQLSLRRDGYHICGAALISPKYALSAAHCFLKQGLYSVKGGSSQKDEGGVTISVKTAILHPERANHPLDYDLAILELQESFIISSKIQPINLAENSNLLQPGVTGIISGFGDRYDSENMGSRILRAAEVFVEHKDQCQEDYSIYGIRLTSSLFCAGLPEGGKDACQGDSGGPFVIDNVLYGLVSYGIGCGDKKHPGIYTSVAEFRDYIRVNTGI